MASSCGANVAGTGALAGLGDAALAGAGATGAGATGAGATGAGATGAGERGAAAAMVVVDRGGEGEVVRGDVVYPEAGRYEVSYSEYWGSFRQPPSSTPKQPAASASSK